MWLYFSHPNHFALSCTDCVKYMQKDGILTRRPPRIGQLVLRVPGTVTPCVKCPKIPDDSPAKTREWAQEMSERNRMAFVHYRECAAVGVWPDDPIVRRNAAIIRGAIDRMREGRLEDFMLLLEG